MECDEGAAWTDLPEGYSLLGRQVCLQGVRNLQRGGYGLAEGILNGRSVFF